MTCERAAAAGGAHSLGTALALISVVEELGDPPVPPVCIRSIGTGGTGRTGGYAKKTKDLRNSFKTCISTVTFKMKQKRGYGLRKLVSEYFWLNKTKETTSFFCQHKRKTKKLQKKKGLTEGTIKGI